MDAARRAAFWMRGEMECATGCPSSTRRAGRSITTRASRKSPCARNSSGREQIEDATDLGLELVRRGAIDVQLRPHRVGDRTSGAAVRRIRGEEERPVSGAQSLHALEVMRAHCEDQVARLHERARELL